MITPDKRTKNKKTTTEEEGGQIHSTLFCLPFVATILYRVELMTCKKIFYIYIHAYIAFCYYEKSAMELITIEDAYRMYPQVLELALVYNY